MCACVRVLVNADERRGSSVQSVGRVWLRGVSRSGVAAQTRGRPGPLCKKEAMWNQASLMGNESLHHGQSRLRGPDIITFPRRASVCSLRAALARRVPIIQSCQMNRARRTAIAFYYEDKRQCGIHDNCGPAPFSPIPTRHTHTHRRDVNRKMIKPHEISPAWM